MARFEQIDRTILLKRMFREARRRGFSIEKTSFIGPGPREGEEQLGRCYPGKRVLLVDGMVQSEQDLTWLHEMGHSLGGRSERVVERVAQEIYHSMTPGQLRRLRRLIPPDTTD